MKRCLVCGLVVEDDVMVCPQCNSTKFEPIIEDDNKEQDSKRNSK